MHNRYFWRWPWLSTLTRGSARRPTPGQYAAMALCALALAAPARAEVLVRWTLDDIPSSHALGLQTIVVPASSPSAIRRAIEQGYRVYVELDGAAIRTFRPPAASFAGVVLTGEVAAARAAELERRIAGTGGRVLRLDRRGRWPHIRTNWVTRNNEVLQVTSRSAQPWIENNAATFRILRMAPRGQQSVLTYDWTPVTIAAADETPRLEHYLVAIAEAGSFGGGLLLPLHEAFQRDLLAGAPQARADWEQMRRHLAFYAWDLPSRYQPVANIGVVVSDPFARYDILNLLLRHNLPFTLASAVREGDDEWRGMDLMIALEPLTGPASERLTDFARRGGIVVYAPGEPGTPATQAPWRGEADARAGDVSPQPAGGGDRAVYTVGSGQVVEMLQPVTDPDRFARVIREMLGRERRVLDIWNGITVLASPWAGADDQSLLVTALNYAHQPLPVQIRVRGTFSLVHHESPEAPLALLPHTHRDGYTEFVLPALITGARVFLTGRIR